MGIGDKLQKAIAKRKTNINDVARRANVNPSVLYSIIRRNSKSVDINVLIAIANILGVPVEYFSDNYEDLAMEDGLLMEDEKSLLSDYRKLNPIGQGKAAEYVNDLTGNPKYKANSSAATPETETPAPDETEEDAATQSA